MIKELIHEHLCDLMKDDNIANKRINEFLFSEYSESEWIAYISKDNFIHLMSMLIDMWSYTNRECTIKTYRDIFPKVEDIVKYREKKERENDEHC